MVPLLVKLTYKLLLANEPLLVMRLLSPKELDVKKQLRLETDIRRGIKLATLIDTEQKKLSEVRTKCEEEKNELIKEYNTFVSDITEKNRLLLAECEDLEKRRLKALEPTEFLLEEAKKKYEEVKVKEKLVEEKEKHLMSVLEDASNKSLFLMEKESELREVEESLGQQQANLQFQFDYIKESNTRLTKAWEEFFKTSKDKERILTIESRKVDDQKNANEVLRIANIKESERLERKDRALKSGYLALEQAKKHLGIV